MIFKENTLKEMEYKYVKKKIFVAQSWFQRLRPSL